MALSAIARGLVERQFEVHIVTAPKPADGPMMTFDRRIVIHSCAPAFGANFRCCPQLYRRLHDLPADIIHSHGLWTYTGAAADRVAKKRRIPHVLAPCGMLQPGALRRSAWKKKLCGLIFENRVIRRAACLHAKSAAEYETLRNLGLRNPIAIIPNPVSLTPLPTAENTAKVSEKVKSKRCLYLGRLHPVKGLTRLIAAWLRVWRAHRDWELILAGPDENGMQSVLKRQLDANNATSTVRFAGPVKGEAKTRLLMNADLFVMPSDFENFGSAIAEAMQAGLPVIATTGSPWKCLAQQAAGWWVTPTVDALQQALGEAMRLTSQERKAMGCRAQAIAAAFTEDAVASQLASLYAWLQGEKSIPEFVSL